MVLFAKYGRPIILKLTGMKPDYNSFLSQISFQKMEVNKVNNSHGT